MIDTGRVSAMMVLITKLPAEEQKIITDQLIAIQHARAAGFLEEIPPEHIHLLPTAAEVMASLEEGRREGFYRVLRDTHGNEIGVKRVLLHDDR